MTADLLDFLRARLDDTERDDSPSHCTGCVGDPTMAGTMYGCDVDEYRSRRLREVEAKRKLIQRYENAVAASVSVVSFTRGQDDGYRQACLDAIRDAAELHSDHPEFRPEWRP